MFKSRLEWTLSFLEKGMVVNTVVKIIPSIGLETGPRAADLDLRPTTCKTEAFLLHGMRPWGVLWAMGRRHSWCSLSIHPIHHSDSGLNVGSRLTWTELNLTHTAYVTEDERVKAESQEKLILQTAFKLMPFWLPHLEHEEEPGKWLQWLLALLDGDFDISQGSTAPGVIKFNVHHCSILCKSLCN